MATVGPRKTRRTNRRLARVRTRRPGALASIQADSKYTPREVRRVRKVDRRVRAQEAAKKQRRAARRYNPLAPITGARQKAEMDAATKLQFGDEESALRNSIASREADVGRAAEYYDDYRQKLREATARVNETNRQNIEAAEGRVDTAHTQDTAGLASRDAASAEAAVKLGRATSPNEEGARAVAAQRAAGNSGVATLRQVGGEQNKMMELREATGALAKAKAVEGASARVRAERGKEKELASKKGAFRVKHRGDIRESEREWAAIRREFGLKEKDLAIKGKTSKADRKLEAQKLRTQRAVARIYGAADKAAARAQVRVAKLQLEKGKINDSQYRHIVNEYRGLPEKGKSGAPVGSGKNGKPGKGSGPNGSYAPWERNKINDAVRILDKQNALPREKSKYMKMMQDAGISLTYARVAWKRYVQQQNEAANEGGRGGRVGDRNQTR